MAAAIGVDLVMKFKWKTWAGLAILAYGLLAFIFMWPPVVTNYRTNWFGRARSTAGKPTCVNYLHQIDGAIQQWALEQGKQKGYPVTLEQLRPYLKGGNIPHCPNDGTYLVTVVGAEPRCSLEKPIKRRIGWFFYEKVGNHILPTP